MPKGIVSAQRDSKNDLKRNTTPINWAHILNEEGLDDLRINFGHFGGDDAVKETVEWEKQSENVLLKREFDDLDKSTWTYTIIKLLKKHKNTYADISAFDYLDERATLSLAWLLALDHNGIMDELGQHRLSDKLLWGSDYPMPIRKQEFNDYSKILSLFYKSIDLKKVKHRTLQVPKEEYGANLPDRKMLLDSLTNRNPVGFLFGG